MIFVDRFVCNIRWICRFSQHNCLYISAHYPSDLFIHPRSDSLRHELDATRRTLTTCTRRCDELAAAAASAAASANERCARDVATAVHQATAMSELRAQLRDMRLQIKVLRNENVSLKQLLVVLPANEADEEEEEEGAVGGMTNCSTATMASRRQRQHERHAQRQHQRQQIRASNELSHDMLFAASSAENNLRLVIGLR